MKKILIVLIFLLLSFSAFANESFDEASYNLERNGLTDENLALIYSMNDKFSSNEKLVLLDRYSLPVVGPFLLNFFIGYGSGSFYLGDMTSGYIQLGLQLGSYLLAGIGAIIHNFGRFESDKIRTDTEITFYVLGGLTLIGNWIYSLITPWIYTNANNGKFQDALYGRESTISWNIEPLVDNKKNFGLQARIEF